MKETLLDVEGMSCNSCVRHVEKALAGVAGVGAVEVELAAGKVRVKHDPQEASEQQLIAALDEAGYPARLPAG